MIENGTVQNTMQLWLNLQVNHFYYGNTVRHTTPFADERGA